MVLATRKEHGSDFVLGEGYRGGEQPEQST